jgi:hypothetical protein
MGVFEYMYFILRYFQVCESWYTEEYTTLSGHIHTYKVILCIDCRIQRLISIVQRIPYHLKFSTQPAISGRQLMDRK